MNGFVLHLLRNRFLSKISVAKKLKFGGVKEEMHWIPIKDLDKYKTFSSFLKEYLSKPHDEIVHIVTHENE